MTKNKEVARAFALFVRSDEGKVLLDYYRLRLSEMDKKSRRLFGDKLLIENGKRISMEEMITDFEIAEQVLGKMENLKAKAVVI